MNVLKLRQLIEGFNPSGQTAAKSDQPIGLGPVDNSQQEEVWSIDEKRQALEAIGEYNVHGKHLYREENNLLEIAHNLSEIAKNAQKFLSKELSEGGKQDAWFDTVMVERNMKDMQKCSDEFVKYAKEAHILEQRMQALYEQMGGNLNRYFEIKDLNEAAQPAVPKIK